jgi:hypothetical protein
MEKLGQRKNEVGNLRNEEQQGSFTKVPKDGYYCYCHSRKIAECVTNKNTSWIPKLNEVFNIRQNRFFF